jgi:addiction module HigA family antidote
MSINQLVKALGVGARMKEIVPGNRGVTADTALRLARHFNTSAEFWLNLQTFYDLRTAAVEGWPSGAVPSGPPPGFRPASSTDIAAIETREGGSLTHAPLAVDGRSTRHPRVRRACNPRQMCDIIPLTNPYGR